MIKVSIIKNGIVTNANIGTQAEIDAWLAKHVAQNTFGLPTRPEVITNPETGLEEETGVVLPAEYEIVQEDVTAQVQAEEAKIAKIKAGQLARKVCEEVLDLVAGYNLERELTLEQITQMQSTFSSAEAALRAGRPTLAKQAIQAISPDGVLITQQMKDDALSLLANY